MDRIEVARVDPGRVTEVLEALRGDPRVEQAEPNHVYHALYEPNDPRFKEQWHLQKIRASDAWDVTIGKGVTVAVIDTGVAYEKHRDFFQVEDLAGCSFAKGFNFLTSDPHGNDDHGHGTHVAGTIAQATNNKIGVAGVAYGCTIMPLKVLSSQGSGTVAHIAQAIRYAADNNAKVINMSLGGPFPSRVMEQACTYAKSKGVLIVCAAGNERRDRVSYPAAYEACVAVSATGPTDELAFYSNYGDKVAIAAPGGDKRFGEAGGVLQNSINPADRTQQGYFSWQGTSMAAPHVAGAAALVMSLGVAKPDKVLQILQSSARKKDDKRRFGAGILDCYAAVKKAKSACGWWRLALALVMAFLAVRWAGSSVRRPLWPSAGFFVCLVIGSSGLFFLPQLGLSWLPLSDTLSTGFPQWDVACLGVERHASPVFYSVAIPLVLAILFMGSAWRRQLLAGFSVGVGAHLAHAALFALGDAQGSLGQNVIWLLANSALCLLLGRVLLKSLARDAR
ncbi:MAG: peptidase S8 [Candidatus Riflebacteria bacterium]|nr:peptidase S8 [Candidatus Riflebacteria bacterium]